MKIYILFALLFSLSFSSIAQKEIEILQTSYVKCQLMRNGYYEMSKYMKYLDRKDTVKSAYTCFFRKLRDDTMSNILFNSSATFHDGYKDAVMYTGNEFVLLTPRDSTAEIMTKSKWGPDVKSRCGNVTFYSPLTSKKSSPIEHDSEFTDNRHIFKFIGEEKLNGVTCFHIQVNKTEDEDTASGLKALRIEFHYWINKEDYIPVQYTIAYDLKIQNDTQYQFERFVLDKYNLNKLKDEKIFTLASIPAFYKRKDYTHYKRPELLPVDSLAPTWELQSLSGEKVNLRDLKGQMVLVDFFYKACYPCMQALPALQALSEKYKGKGLKVVGIDPFDSKDGLAEFLAKRGVTYQVLLAERSLANSYHVSGYPTMYLIDRSGRIIYTQVGYGKETEAELEKIIEQHLQ